MVSTLATKKCSLEATVLCYQYVTVGMIRKSRKLAAPQGSVNSEPAGTNASSV